MDFFQTIGAGMEKAFDSFSDMGKRVKYEAKVATENSKIRLKKREAESSLKGLFKELGESYYNDLKEGKELLRPVEDILKEIEEVEEEISALENSLRYRKFKEEVVNDDVLRCEYCNEELNHDDLFCANCGTPVSEDDDLGDGCLIDDVMVHTILCPNCGEQMNIHSKFCTRCGKNLE
ncbi:MAG: zinc ribbon domain-containing protein [Tissierellia bacterium]|nr:zinc ribbon domain-containing protein [Tissierellia bacterium]